MRTIVLSVLGKDQTGLVEKLAQAVSNADGSWLAGRFCSLSGHFTGFVEVLLPAQNQSLLVNECEAITQLSITLLPAENKIAPDANDSASSTKSLLNSIKLKVTGNDRQGIVGDVTNALSAFDINIIDLDTSLTSAPNWGTMLFSASFVVETSQTIDASQLKEAIEQIADDLMVETLNK